MGRPCAVERAYEEMSSLDRWAMRIMIETPAFTAGAISEILHKNGYPGIDRAAVGHFRRKLAIGKATL